jgi:hypothetical protein
MGGTLGGESGYEKVSFELSCKKVMNDKQLPMPADE